jgi:hypothetical protein
VKAVTPKSAARWTDPAFSRNLKPLPSGGGAFTTSPRIIGRYGAIAVHVTVCSDHHRVRLRQMRELAWSVSLNAPCLLNYVCITGDDCGL